jgi:carboxylesterase type B
LQLKNQAVPRPPRLARMIQTLLGDFSDTVSSSSLINDSVDLTETSAIPQLANQMHSAWVSFIKGGQPTASGSPDWRRYSAEGERARETMILDDRSELVQDPVGKECALWDGIL